MTQDEIIEALTYKAPWKNRTHKVTPGTYKLEAGIPNFPKLIDRRHVHDWRAMEILPAGEYVIEVVHQRSAEGTVLRLWRVQNNGTLYNVHCWDERFWLIYSSATRVKETPSRFLTAGRNENWALDVLDVLVEHGQLSMKQVKVALERAQLDFEAKEDRLQATAKAFCCVCDNNPRDPNNAKGYCSGCALDEEQAQTENLARNHVDNFLENRQ